MTKRYSKKPVLLDLKKKWELGSKKGEWSQKAKYWVTRIFYGQRYKAVMPTQDSQTTHAHELQIHIVPTYRSWLT